MKQLNQLTRVSRETQGRNGNLQLKDDLSHLTEKRRRAWGRILTSAAHVENLEEILIRPIRAQARDTEVAEYLDSHSSDEQRHHDLLTHYAARSLDYERKGRTLSDRIFHSGLLPMAGKLIERAPVVGFALLHCYELFTLPVYSRLRKIAQEDGAQNLVTLLGMIEKDELRHIAGMKELIVQERRRRGRPFGPTVLSGSAALLGVFLADTRQGAGAIHNREFGAMLGELGFPLADFNQAAKDSARRTFALLRQ